MSKKLELNVESLAVDSFENAPPAEQRGTVQGHGPDPTPPEYECTYAATCLCKTAYYQCGTGPYTIYSCNYTNDWRCSAGPDCTA